MPQTNTQPKQRDIYGQYAMDWALYPDQEDLVTKKDHTGTLDMRGDGNLGFHQGSVLFDHIDRTVDVATGEAQFREDETAHYRELGLHIGELPVARTTKLDAAEMWLQQHDPDYNR